MKSQESLKYPIGKFEYGKAYSLDETRKHIKAIAKLPRELKKVLKKLKASQLDRPYRRGGWTARQVIHHIADSHMNAYIRMKLAVTEQTPIIKPYEESLWAGTEDGKNAPVKLSLRILTPLHKRWVMFLESLSEEDLECGYYHPGMQRVIPLPEAIALYAWHSQHHVAHILLVAKGKARREEVEEKAAKLVAAIEPKKRGRNTIQQQMQSENQKAQAKRIAQSSTTPKKSTPEKLRRKRRSNAEVAAEKAAKAAMPKLSRAEVLAKARAARAANLAKQAPATTKKSAAAPTKRKRRSSAEVAAEKAAKAAMPKLSRAEALAKARAARAANLPKKAPAAPKAKPAGEKKRRGLSPERMAEIRALKGKKK